MSTATKSQAEGFAFYEGRPIGRFEDDGLGRKPFARFFAEAISRHHGNEGLVLAVNAPWGEGKTSFKNMGLDEVVLVASQPRTQPRTAGGRQLSSLYAAATTA